ncbi:MAG: rane-bound dehydrogenase domain protein [Verrucomicrobiales bacterium]|nr:rane-bound dehydrogenase domain protein [Verrucomicrobiales bacterium]
MKPTSLVLISAALTVTASAQRDLKELPPVDSNIEKSTFKLPAALDVNLFAQEPLIAKPIQMAWDEKGRLWLASSSIYPHIKPGQTQADKIVILEDTNRDGTADKSTTFYEGLLIPTGILPGDGGAYVANSTELLFMKDTNGDGRADESKVLLSGFGTEDTHHILHSIKRGPDGCLYFAQSVYIHSRIETPYGVRELRGSGWWQYRPETGRLEVYSMGQVNPWGLVWDKWGQTFTTDGAYGEGINYTFPGATFLCLPNQLPRILKGLNPGQPKQAGLEIISGRHFPDDWQGHLITADFRGHRVNHFAVKTEGSGFSSQQLEDTVQSTHGSFRPVDQRMGPDGALYLADWFNPIIQHGEVDFHDERRDREHGRIWRVTAKGRGLSPQPDYAKAGVDELLDLLDAPEDWIRTEVKQELKRRKVEDLEKRVMARAQAPGVKPEWLKDAVGLLQTTALLRADSAILTLPAGDDFAAYAVRASGQLFREGAPGNVELIKQAAVSPSARVRLEAVHASRMMRSAAGVEMATNVLDAAMDSNLDFALWLTCRELADIWLPAFQKGEITFGGNVAHIAFALKAADRPEAVGALLTLVQNGKVAEANLAEALGLAGALGSAADLGKLLDLASGPQASPALVLAGYKALTAAASQRQTVPGAGQDRILTNLGSGNAALRAAAAGLAGAWKLEAARPVLESQAKAWDGDAMEALAALGGEASKSFLTQLADSPAPAGAADADGAKAHALSALASMDAPLAAGKAAGFLASTTNAAAASQVFESFLARKEGPGLLAGVLRDKKLRGDVAAAGVQKAGARGAEAKDLVDVLTIAGGLQPVGVGMTPEAMNAMMAEVKEKGDAARGELIYRRQALLCQNCHAVGAVGGVVGPDLLSIGASAPVDYIIDSLLEPSKKVKEGYATTVVNTKNGGVFSGFLVREDAREVLLRDAAGTTQSIPVADIASKQSMPVSLMPPGLTGTLRRDEFVDLVRFLSELGKEGKYKVKVDGVIRRWRLPQPAADFWQVINRDGIRALTVEQAGLAWVPAYSEVGGSLPVSDIPEVKLFQASGRVAQGEVEVTTPGAMLLKFAEPAGMKVWVDDKEIQVAAEVPMDLPVGKHRITVLLDPAARQAPLRIEAISAPGSNGRVVPVGGV